MSSAVREPDPDVVTPLPNSRRVYIAGEQGGVRVPFREISQTPTRSFDGSLEDNSTVTVYDTSGPWGDPSQRCDVTVGLPALRRHWILERDDVEEYSGREAKPIDDGYLTVEAASRARVKDVGKLEDFPGLRRSSGAPPVWRYPAS